MAGRKNSEGSTKPSTLRSRRRPPLAWIASSATCRGLLIIRSCGSGAPPRWRRGWPARPARRHGPGVDRGHLGRGQPSGQTGRPTSAAGSPHHQDPDRPARHDAPLHVVSLWSRCLGIRIRHRRGDRVPRSRAPTDGRRGAGRLLACPHGRPLPERRNRRIGARCGAGNGGRFRAGPPPRQLDAARGFDASGARLICVLNPSPARTAAGRTQIRSGCRGRFPPRSTRHRRCPSCAVG